MRNITYTTDIYTGYNFSSYASAWPLGRPVGPRLSCREQKLGLQNSHWLLQCMDILIATTALCFKSIHWNSLLQYRGFKHFISLKNVVPRLPVGRTNLSIHSIGSANKRFTAVGGHLGRWRNFARFHWNAVTKWKQDEGSFVTSERVNL